VLEAFTLILVGGAIAWFWADSLRAKERAVSVSKQFCQLHRAQYLDDTVSLASLSVRRQTKGRLAMYRVYEFEVNRLGNEREIGTVSMHGSQIISVYLPEAPPSGIAH
jgi:hypothetical protein